MMKFGSTISFGFGLLFLPALHAVEGDWLLGVSGGAYEIKSGFNVDIGYQGPVAALLNFPRTSFSQDFSNTQSAWGILGGYQIRANGWRFGLEGNIDWLSGDRIHHFRFSDVLGWTATGHYERSPIYGITSRIAYQMAPYFIAFVRFGVEFGKDEFDMTLDGDPNIYPFYVALHDNGTHSQYVVGFGAEIPLKLHTMKMCITPHLRFEYDYHAFFRDHALEAHGLIVDGALNPIFVTTTHPDMHSGKVSIVWYFG